MKLKPRLAALGAIAALGFASIGHAAVVTVEQSLELNNPTQGLVYNIATDGQPSANTTSFYELVVDPSWNVPTKFITLATEPVGGEASYTLYTDADAGAVSGNTGTLLTSWTRTDIAANNSLPFFTYLLTAGQYLLRIDTTPGQFNISTQISAVPLPGAMWLFGSALLAFLGYSRRRKL